jgi:hypothetical protein
MNKSIGFGPPPKTKKVDGADTGAQYALKDNYKAFGGMFGQDTRFKYTLVHLHRSSCAARVSHISHVPHSFLRASLARSITDHTFVLTLTVLHRDKTYKVLHNS